MPETLIELAARHTAWANAVEAATAEHLKGRPIESIFKRRIQDVRQMAGCVHRAATTLRNFYQDLDAHVTGFAELAGQNSTGGEKFIAELHDLVTHHNLAEVWAKVEAEYKKRLAMAVSNLRLCADTNNIHAVVPALPPPA